jgi:hypothetical protein
MRAAFTHVSLLIDLPHEPWSVGPQAYFATAKPFPRRSRILVHESMHYWHQICHGYLLSLGQEDWLRMRAWEQDGITTPSPFRDGYGTRTGRHRISPHDLCECLSRFWEVLFVGADVLRNAVDEATTKDPRRGPPEELKDMAARKTSDVHTLSMAMELSGAYARPFLVVRHAFDVGVGPVLFPLLVHFALKTPRPVEYFDRFVDEVAPGIAARITAPSSRVVEFGELAKALYPHVLEHCAGLVRETDGTGLLNASNLFTESPLRENAAYAWSLRRWAAAAKVFGEVSMDAAVCIPIVDEFRRLLTWGITPPCVRFADGTTLGLCHRFDTARHDVAPDDVAAAEAVAGECRSLQERWENFESSQTAKQGR